MKLTAGGYADGTDDQADPKAFVTIVLFDKDYNFLDVAYAQLKGTSLYYMKAEYTVKEPGYAFMYVSNEQQTETDVYFDDVTMAHTPTNIVQYNEYYPFGLQTSSSWTRENSSNNFLYNSGSEQNPTTGLYDLPFRNYDPALGRFMQVDPLATKYASLSGYHYSYNNPVMFNDPSGADPIFTGYPDNGGSGSQGDGGNMPMWYSSGTTTKTGDSNGTTVVDIIIGDKSYTVTIIGYAGASLSFDNGDLTSYTPIIDVGAVTDSNGNGVGFYLFYDQTTDMSFAQGTGGKGNSFQAGHGQQMDNLNVSVKKPSYYSYGSGWGGDPNSVGDDPNWAMKFLIKTAQVPVELGSVFLAAVGNAYTIIKNEGFVDSPSIKNQPYHPIHLDDNGNITDKPFYPPSGGVPVGRGVELLNATSNAVIGAAAGGFSVEVNYFNSTLMNQGLGAIMTQGVQEAVSTPLQMSVEYGTSKMK